MIIAIVIIMSFINENNGEPANNSTLYFFVRYANAQ